MRLISLQYCDDIRLEVGNKVSLMGNYTGEMLIANFPAVLAKLCVQAKIITPVDRPFRELTVRAFLDDDLLGELTFAPEQLMAAASAALPQHSENGLMSLMTHMTLSPFHVSAPGKLRIEAQTEDELIKGSSLRINQARGAPSDSPSGEAVEPPHN